MKLSSDAHISGFLGSIKSYTSDQGTEGGLPDLIVESHSSLLPEWLATTELQRDVDASNDVEDDAFVGSPILGLDVDNGSDSDAGLVCDVDNDEGYEPNIEPLQIPIQYPNGHFLPESLTVVALQHIVDGMTNEMHTSLNHWDDFHKKLKSLKCLSHSNHIGIGSYKRAFAIRPMPITKIYS